MKKAILITTLLIASFASYSQITMIKTDSLSFNDKTVPSKYKFFYNESFVSFGKLEEETTDLPTYNIEKPVIDGDYVVITKTEINKNVIHKSEIKDWIKGQR